MRQGQVPRRGGFEIDAEQAPRILVLFRRGIGVSA
jgi:hypothetical protein